MLGSFELTSTMHRFLLPKCPRLEDSLRNESDVEEDERHGYLMWILKKRNVVVNEVNPPPLLRVLTMVLAASVT